MQLRAKFKTFVVARTFNSTIVHHVLTTWMLLLRIHQWSGAVQWRRAKNKRMCTHVKSKAAGGSWRAPKLGPRWLFFSHSPQVGLNKRRQGCGGEATISRTEPQHLHHHHNSARQERLCQNTTWPLYLPPGYSNSVPHYPTFSTQNISPSYTSPQPTPPIASSKTSSPLPRKHQAHRNLPPTNLRPAHTSHLKPASFSHPQSS